MTDTIAGQSEKRRGLMPEALGWWVEAREMKGIDLAAEMSVTPAYLSSLLHGRRPIQPKRLDEMARILRLSNFARQYLHALGAQDAGWDVPLPEPPKEG